MTEINLQTWINATPESCFNASLDVDLHLGSASHTNERVIAGRKSGICELGDEIIWEARHFGIKLQLSIRITDLKFPTYFADQMTRGAFQSMRHEHFFEPAGTGCLMRDRFMYETPFWVFGQLFDLLLLRRHMRDFLLRRNAFLKDWCEKNADDSRP